MKPTSRFLVTLLATTTIFSLFSTKLRIPQLNSAGYLHFTAINGILQAAEMWASNDQLSFLCMRIQKLLQEQRPTPTIRVAVNTNSIKQTSVDGYKTGVIKSLQRILENGTYLLEILLDGETETILFNPYTCTILINVTNIIELNLLRFDQIEAFNFYFATELGLPNQFDQVA